ncbi:MAG TPA: hypothetical protein VGK67_02785 [Myxococcales bacterium]
MTTGHIPAATAFGAVLGALGLAGALCGCELLVRPDEVPPPGPGADDAGLVRSDAGCVPTRECVKGSCGLFDDDGCGQPLNCGKCLAALLCQDHVCIQPCTPETDLELCAAAGAQCGSLAVGDRCGKPRTPVCGAGGSCPSGTVCGGNPAKPNACACNAASCQGATRCDAATGSCVAGCSTAAQCPSGGVCSNDTCLCPGGGHECSGACVPNDPAHCGTGCLQCPTDAHGTASCDGTACRLACEPGYTSCSSTCVACPAHGKAFGCAADGTCLATECDSGYSVCDGACCTWQIDTVGTATAGGRLSIAVDANDVSHIAFLASTKEMRWAKRNSTGSWTVETLDTTGTITDDQLVSVGVMPGGEPAVLYLDGKGNVRLAERKKNGTSGWTKSTVFTPVSPSAPLAPALVVQGDGTLHAVFAESGGPGDPYAVHYATRTLLGSTWTRETVDGPDCIGLATAIALDAAGKPAIAAAEIGVGVDYEDVVSFFSRGAAAWAPEQVDAGALGYSLSLAIGASGVQLGFVRGTFDTLVHATLGTPWKLVDALKNSSKDDASLVLDAQGNPHFAFVSSVSGAVRHAYFTSGGWVSELVDSNGAGVAAAVDKAGRLRIVYRNTNSGAVKHAWVGN